MNRFIVAAGLVLTLHASIARADITYTFDTDRNGWFHTGGGPNLSVSSGEMVFTSTATVRGMTGAMPSITLVDPGDTITLTFDFRYTATVDSNQAGFRFGLYNQNGTPMLSDGSTAFQNDFGYVAVVPTGTATSADFTALYTEKPAGTVLGGTDLGKLQVATASGFGTGTGLHQGIMSITKTASGLDIVAKVDAITYYNFSHATPLTETFDEIVFSTGQNLTGAQSMLFDNVVVTYAAVPEPSSAILAGVACLGAAFARRRRQAAKLSV